MRHEFDTRRPYKVLIADPVGFAGVDASHLDVQSHIHARAGVFHRRLIDPAVMLEAGKYCSISTDRSSREALLRAEGEKLIRGSDRYTALTRQYGLSGRFTD